jgi:ABC-type Mn2+/Zn2+ transport system ATPase subunit
MVTDTNSFPAIEVEHLTVSFGPKPALLDVSLKIEPSLLVGIIGPNGAGKSTLVKAILGFAQPDLGTIRVFGTPLEQARGRMAYVPQRGAVDWDYPITVYEVTMMGRYGSIPWWSDPSPEDKQLVDEALTMVRMEAEGVHGTGAGTGRRHPTPGRAFRGS